MGICVNIVMQMPIAGLVRENMKQHISTSPFLIGKEEPGDKITEAKQKSWIEEEEQISFYKSE